MDQTVDPFSTVFPCNLDSRNGLSFDGFPSWEGSTKKLQIQRRWHEKGADGDRLQPSMLWENSSTSENCPRMHKSPSLSKFLKVLTEVMVHLLMTLLFDFLIKTHSWCIDIPSGSWRQFQFNYVDLATCDAVKRNANVHNLDKYSLQCAEIQFAKIILAMDT